MAKLPVFVKVIAGTQPEYVHPDYRSSVKRAPTRPLILLPHSLSERTGPVFGQDCVGATDCDLTAQHAGAPLGERIAVSGRPLTDADGRYHFLSIKPGAYPWGNHTNAWRPAHIHFSIFGDGLLSRLVTQMYFPGDPLLALDPIYNSISSKKDRQRLISSFDLATTTPDFALGYRFDIVLRGRDATPMEK